MIDCSHGNSYKRHDLQSAVFQNILQQILDGNRSIVGMMLESNLNEGNQKIPRSLSQLKYGVSVTDKCIGWQTTESLILSAYKSLSEERKAKFSTCGVTISGTPVRNLLATKG